MGSRRELTERDRFWLDHEKAISKSGQSAKAYAAEQGLSLHALYQARKRLKAEGHLASGKITPARERRTQPGAGVAFSKIELASDLPRFVVPSSMLAPQVPPAGAKRKRAA
jgi:hypothetical protein